MKTFSIQPLTIADTTFQSRFFVGTGKFSSSQVMKNVLEVSGTELVTVAVRRVDLSAQEKITDSIPTSLKLLPNTSGARNAQEAIYLAKLCREVSKTNWIKLEVTSDSTYLLPDPIETLKAAETLVKDGFIVLPYMNADPVLAKRLENIGCATVMPLGSPIGTNQGIQTLEMIRLIIDLVNIPVVVDAGLGSPSQAALAMEIGADAVLVNTALAVAKDPIAMAYAFKQGVLAGRLAFEAGLGKKNTQAQASSPLTGFLHQ